LFTIIRATIAILKAFYLESEDVFVKTSMGSTAEIYAKKALEANNNYGRRGILQGKSCDKRNKYKPGR